jgi:hypothetical protein
VSGAALQLLAVAIGTVLVIAAVSKLVAAASVEGFLTAAGVSKKLARELARALPPAELGIGALLVSAAAPKVGAALAVALTFSFALVQLRAGRQRESVGCRCFGVLDEGISAPFAVARALGLFAASVALLSAELSTAATPAFDWAASASGAAVGAGSVLAFALVHEVRDFERRRPHAVRAAGPPPAGPTA